MTQILIIDDDPEEYDIFLTALSDLKSECICNWAETAKAGLEILQSMHSDLIFVDHSMPGIDGIECIKAIRRIPMHNATCIILYSTYMDDDVRFAALNAGATFSYEKPHKISAITALIQIVWETCLHKKFPFGFSL